MQKIFPCPRISLFDCWCSSCPVFSGRIWSAMDRPGAINWSNTTSSRISKQINKHKKTVKFFYQNLLQKIFSNKFSQIVCYRDGKYFSGDSGSSNEWVLGLLFWRTVSGRPILRRPGWDHLASNLPPPILVLLMPISDDSILYNHYHRFSHSNDYFLSKYRNYYCVR